MHIEINSDIAIGKQKSFWSKNIATHFYILILHIK